MKLSESIEAFARAVQLIKEAKLTSDQKEKNTKELEDNMKATKLGSAATKNTLECSNEGLEIIEEHNWMRERELINKVKKETKNGSERGFHLKLSWSIVQKL